MKHFNRGNVWGRVVNLTSEKKKSQTPNLQLKIDCSSEKYGRIKTYGRIWGEDRIKAFQALYKEHKNDLFRFTGFLQQYRKEDGMMKVYNNFTFYDWQLAVLQEGKEPRAAFIIVGDVTQKGTFRGEGRLIVDLLRSGYDEERPVEENFELWTATGAEISGLTQGKTYELKGMIKPREAEDEFGGPGGEIKAYIMAMRERSEGE
jgi:hypothetical protein